jgi:hypothetical protein
VSELASEPVESAPAQSVGGAQRGRAVRELASEPVESAPAGHTVSPARRLLAEIIRDPDLAGRLEADEPMLYAGVNSGDLVRLALAVERAVNRPLSEPEVTGIRTLADVDRLLATGPSDVAH